MSKIRLHGSSSGYMEIAPPAAGSSATVTLPNSAGEILLSDGSAASLTQIPAANIVGVCTAGLTKTGGFGKFASYAVLTDVKSSNANGGTFTTGDWRTRDLNTETTDEDGIVSLSSNQFTLGVGSYLIQYFAPACQVNSHQARLYNITDSSEASLGSTEYAGTGSNMPQTTSYGYIRLTLTGSKVFELQHRCSATTNNYAFGVGTSGGFDWGTVKYATVVIYKES